MGKGRLAESGPVTGPSSAADGERTDLGGPATCPMKKVPEGLQGAETSLSPAQAETVAEGPSRSRGGGAEDLRRSVDRRGNAPFSGHLPEV